MSAPERCEFAAGHDDVLFAEVAEAKQSLHELREAFQHLRLKHDEALGREDAANLRGYERAQALVALKAERDKARDVIAETLRLVRDADVWAAIDYIKKADA